MKFKRVLVKLSGEALAGKQQRGFDHEVITGVAKQLKTLVDGGIEVAVVIGGGNFWRGRTSGDMDRTKADQIGMLATVMNAIYVADVCRSLGIATSVQTPFALGSMTDLFSKDKAVADFKAGKIVFFAGGTGHPFFSTDTGAALRGAEVEVDALFILLIYRITGCSVVILKMMLIRPSIKRSCSYVDSEYECISPVVLSNSIRLKASAKIASPSYRVKLSTIAKLSQESNCA